MPKLIMKFKLAKTPRESHRLILSVPFLPLKVVSRFKLGLRLNLKPVPQQVQFLNSVPKTHVETNLMKLSLNDEVELPDPSMQDAIWTPAFGNLEANDGNGDCLWPVVFIGSCVVTSLR